MALALSTTLRNIVQMWNSWPARARACVWGATGIGLICYFQVEFGRLRACRRHPRHLARQ